MVFTDTRGVLVFTDTRGLLVFIDTRGILVFIDTRESTKCSMTHTECEVFIGND